MIDEQEGRWFQFTRPSRRVNPFVDPGSYIGTTAPRAATGLSAYRKVRSSKCYEWLSSWFIAATQMNQREIHPIVKVSAIVSGGFMFVLMAAGVLSGLLMSGLPTPLPIMAAVTRPAEAALAATVKSMTQSDGPTGAQPPGAADGVPAAVMPLYQDAARTCGMPWEVLAAIGRVETNDGASNANGVHGGANFAGAEGPMQFMPATWAKYGVDGDHDGKANIYDQTDAVYGAAKYLCANGAANAATIHNAIWHYNHDNSYVNTVLSLAQSYRANAYVLPVTAEVAKTVSLTRPHHDYPADDIDMPAGTQIYAVRGGTVHISSNSSCGNEVLIDGTDGVTYTYCHARSVDVANGTVIDTGAPLLHSGGKPGAPGAGDSTGPHLHLQITVSGRNVCPQSLLTAWASGEFKTPASATTSGCVS